MLQRLGCYAEISDWLDIRLAQVIEVQVELSAPKRVYRLTVDFDRFGTRISVGGFTDHAPEEIRGKKVLGVLNFAPRTIGTVASEVLILGVQHPTAESGGATFVTPMSDVKIGGRPQFSG